MKTDKYAETFRKRLIAERKKRGLSQYKLAQMMNCDHSTLSYLESGRNKTPKFHILLSAALALGRPLDYLCGLGKKL